MPEKLLKDWVKNYLIEKYPDYGFDKFEYINRDHKSVVLCTHHGEILRSFRDLQRTSAACPKCASNVKLTTQDFLRKLKERFPKTWDSCIYEKTDYTTALEKVEIECKRHGPFLAKPAVFFVSSRPTEFPCPKCNIEIRVKNQISTKELFLEKVKNKIPNRSNRDDFSKFQYSNSHTKTEIICREHGSYFMSPGEYLNNDRRCPKCSSSQKSSPELELFDFVKSICPEAIPRSRNILSKLEIDIFIPSKKIGIEYNGLFFHREINDFDKFSGKMASRTSLLKKAEEAQKEGVFLVHIFEDEWLFKKEQVKNRLKSLLKKSERIFARKCEVRELTKAEAEEFENRYHLQGFSPSASFRYGLFYNGNLCASMSFCKIRFGEKRPGYFELLRYCSSLTVVGGFSKLLRQFLKHVSVAEKIYSYSDKRWSRGNVYEKNGFKKISSSDPGYFWCKGQRRNNRILFQRHKLENLFGKKFHKDLTEKEILYSEGFFQVKDCGQDKWEYLVKK